MKCTHLDFRSNELVDLLRSQSTLSVSERVEERGKKLCSRHSGEKERGQRGQRKEKKIWGKEGQCKERKDRKDKGETELRMGSSEYTRRTPRKEVEE